MISLVLATYNGGHFLREQLFSLANQSLPPDEMIIADDGSSDDTVAIAREFAATAPFKVVFTESGQRLGYARNFCSAAAQCSGDFIFFCDQDDVWRRDKIEVVSDIAATRPETVFAHDLQIFSEEKGVIIPSYYAYLRDAGLPVCVSFKGCSLAVKTDFVSRWGLPPATSSVSHDFWIALLASAFNDRFNIPETLISHRIHSANASGWIATPKDLVWLREHPTSPDAAVLIDACIKPWNLDWTDIFLDALDARADRLDPVEVRNFSELLRRNFAHYRAAKPGFISRLRGVFFD